MDNSKIIKAISLTAKRMEKEKQFLTELDNVIGDGDHGINMDRGFTEVKEKVDNTEFSSVFELLKTIGMTLVAKVGGAAGPLYGTIFINMAKVFMGKDEFNIPDFLEAFKSAIDGVSARGKSTKGEKTMLDAMIPALNAMETAFNDGKDFPSILDDGIKAAWEGVEFTKTIIATKGRASYVGERSIGHQDPGATSFTMMLEEFRNAIS